MQKSIIDINLPEHCSSNYGTEVAEIMFRFVEKYNRFIHQ